MRHVILVHGRNANALSWNGLEKTLSTPDRSVRAPTLPDHDDRLPFLRILWFAATGRLAEARAALDDPDSPIDMDDCVDAVVRRLPEDGSKATLVGHSMGGAVVSQAAARRPERIERVIYVAAMLPDAGQTAGGIQAEIEKGGVDSIAALRAFEAVGSDVVNVLVRQPTGPLSAPFARTPAFEAIPKTFFLSLQDGIIPIAHQRRMIARYPEVVPVELETGHLPQYEDRSSFAVRLSDAIDGQI